MNSNEYWTEVRSIAANIVAEALAAADGDREQAEEAINDSLHEAIDSHQWVIYYSYNPDVLKHSDNAEYMADNIGGLEESLKQGLDTLHCHLAFWALYADVQNALEAAFESSSTEEA